jgi:UDP-glucose 4-epimerase
MATCCITGGAGFIGSHLARALATRGLTVRVVDNLSTGKLANLGADLSTVEITQGDLTNLDVIRQAVEGTDYVYHFAMPAAWNDNAPNSILLEHAATTATMHVLIAAREARVKRVIFASSGRVYGSFLPVPRREDEPSHPTTDYARAKEAGERDCVAFTYLYGLETVRLRFFQVYGPRSSSQSGYARLLQQITETMLEDRRPVIPGNGQEPQDLLYVDDAVHACLLAAEAPRIAGRVYNIGCGRPTHGAEIVGCLNRILGKNLEPVFTSPSTAHELENIADMGRAEKELGFVPWIGIEQGLKLLAESMLGRTHSLPEPKSTQFLKEGFRSEKSSFETDN